MTGSFLTLVRQLVAAGCALVVTLAVVGCAGEPSLGDASPLAGRWVQTQSGEFVSTVKNPSVGANGAHAGLLTRRGQPQLVISDDGRTLTYISRRGRETAYEVREDLLCNTTGPEPFCFSWRLVGDRLLFCDQPAPDGCRIFERPPSATH